MNLDAQIWEIRHRFRELIKTATLICPLPNHYHDHVCYTSPSLDYLTGQYDALRSLQRSWFHQTNVEKLVNRLILSRTKIVWNIDLSDVKVGDQVSVQIDRFGIDGDYEVVEIDPDYVTLEA